MMIKQPNYGVFLSHPKNAEHFQSLIGGTIEVIPEDIDPSSIREIIEERIKQGIWVILAWSALIEDQYWMVIPPPDPEGSTKTVFVGHYKGSAKDAGSIEGR